MCICNPLPSLDLLKPGRRMGSKIPYLAWEPDRGERLTAATGADSSLLVWNCTIMDFGH